VIASAFHSVSDALLELAEAVPERKGAPSDTVRATFFERVGYATLGYGLSVNERLSWRAVASAR
jgi:hypothetical protein